MTKITQWLCVTGICFIVSACGSSSDTVAIANPEDAGQGAVSEPIVVGNVQNDAEMENETLQCDADFDHAELLFTEPDRQWFCAVASTELASSDDVYFSRDGTAVFTRFGQVYWNRNLQTNEINIASPFISSFVMRDINSANTTLQFTVNADTESAQQYDCVLVDRADMT